MKMNMLEKYLKNDNNCYNNIGKYLTNEDIYNLFKNSKVLGSNNIEPFCKYIYDNGIIDNYDSDYKPYYFIEHFNFNEKQNINKILNSCCGIKLKYFSDEQKKDKEFVLPFIEYEPYNIRYANLKFLNDKDIIKLVAKEYGYITEAISERLCDDDEIINIAIENNKFAIKHASQRIKDNNNELLEKIKDKTRWLADDHPLQGKTYFLDEIVLTDNKYIEMRKSYEYKIYKEEEEYKNYLQKRREVKNYNDCVEIIEKIHKHITGGGTYFPCCPFKWFHNISYAEIYFNDDPENTNYKRCIYWMSYNDFNNIYKPICKKKGIF